MALLAYRLRQAIELSEGRADSGQVLEVAQRAEERDGDRPEQDQPPVENT